MTTSSTELVARLAATLAVNLDKVRGTGVGGRITGGDVRAAAGLPRDTPPAGAAHRSTAAEPAVFASGALPPFTASGIDPTMLLRVPPAARPAMARAATTAEAYGILTSFDGLDPDAAAQHADEIDTADVRARINDIWPTRD